MGRVSRHITAKPVGNKPNVVDAAGMDLKDMALTRGDLRGHELAVRRGQQRS